MADILFLDCLNIVDKNNFSTVAVICVIDVKCSSSQHSLFVREVNKNKTQQSCTVSEIEKQHIFVVQIVMFKLHMLI